MASLNKTINALKAEVAGRAAVLNQVERVRDRTVAVRREELEILRRLDVTVVKGHWRTMDTIRSL